MDGEKKGSNLKEEVSS